MASDFLPCPVCAGELFMRQWPFVDGPPGWTPIMVDCVDRHRATTQPQEWELLRIDTMLREVRLVMDQLPARRGRGHHA